MRFLLANARFAQGKFEEAIKDYEQYRTDFPKGTHAEDVEYRIAVGLVFSGKYEKAMGALDKYLQQYPKGAFAPDARYRLALCYYAANQYDEVIKRCREWEKDFGKDQQLGEVLALLGDSLMAKGETDEGVATYIRSYKAAMTDEVLGYSLFEAQKAQQKKGDWQRMSEMFQEFVKEHPEHPIVPMAMFWIGKAKAHDGKVDEAKQFIADTIKKYIDDPRRDAVEQLLTQLAQLCARKKRPAPVAMESPSATPAAVANTSPSATPVATPTPEPQVGPGVELDQLLGNAGEQSQTAKARIIYAKAEIARLRKKTDEQNKLLAGIAHDFKPEDLSPMLLAGSGDVLFARGETEKAAALFQHLMDNYPKSDVVDFAYNGPRRNRVPEEGLPKGAGAFYRSHRGGRREPEAQGRDLRARQMPARARQTGRSAERFRAGGVGPRVAGRGDGVCGLFAGRDPVQARQMGRGECVVPARLCRLPEIPAVGGQGLHHERGVL